MNILDFAKDGNADEAYAQIREAEEFNLVIADELVQIADDYEKGNYGDSGFCDKIIKYIEGIEPKKYVCVLVEREDWDNWLQASCPQLAQVEAMNESEAYDKFAEDRGFSTEEMKAGEEDGDIVIVIKEVSRWKR